MLVAGLCFRHELLRCVCQVVDAKNGAKEKENTKSLLPVSWTYVFLLFSFVGVEMTGHRCYVVCLI